MTKAYEDSIQIACCMTTDYIELILWWTKTRQMTNAQEDFIQISCYIGTKYVDLIT